jgi:hypothetical protein
MAQSEHGDGIWMGFRNGDVRFLRNTCTRASLEALLSSTDAAAWDASLFGRQTRGSDWLRLSMQRRAEMIWNLGILEALLVVTALVLRWSKIKHLSDNPREVNMPA